MVFKIVRVDVEDAIKTELTIGTHLIGRGKFLDCDDKRISRNHGNLIVTQDSVAITALHQNPCFLKRKGNVETDVIKKSCTETLNDGDKFGLLPGSYWYEVLSVDDSQATDVSYTQEQVNSEAQEPNHCKNETPNDNLENGPIENGLLTRDGWNIATSCEVGFEEKGDSNLINFDLNETVPTAGRSDSPSLLDQPSSEQPVAADQSTNHESKDTTSVADPIVKQEPIDTSVVFKQEPESTDSPTKEPSSPGVKRSHSPDEVEGVKKIKTEPVDVKQEDATAGPSNDQVSASSTNDDVSKPPPPSPPKPPNRERCIYGASCYRRNPQHKAQFSHPADADWGTGPRAPCPYGASCRKRDPRHWDMHEHPPATKPPPPVGRTKAKRQQRRRQSEESDSDDTSPSNLILTQKRARKPLPQASPGSDSETHDPFASDGSDDWEPPSDFTESLDF